MMKFLIAIILAICIAQSYSFPLGIGLGLPGLGLGAVRPATTVIHHPVHPLAHPLAPRVTTVVHHPVNPIAPPVVSHVIHHPPVLHPALSHPALFHPALFHPALFHPAFGKRSIEDITVSNSTEVTCEITSFESVSSKMFCEGKTHNFECDLERHFSIEHMEHQLEELRILPKEEPKEKLSKSVILSVRPEESMFNNFTMEHKNETMLFTLFHDKDFTDEGFRVKNLTCWEKFEEMMDQNEQVKLSMKLSF